MTVSLLSFQTNSQINLVSFGSYHFKMQMISKIWQTVICVNKIALIQVSQCIRYFSNCLYYEITKTESQFKNDNVIDESVSFACTSHRRDNKELTQSYMDMEANDT